MAATQKKWTVMVYMAGDNNLDTAGLTDLKEMKKAGSTADINIIAQFDNGADHITKRYFLTKGGKLEKDVVPPVLGKTNDGDPKVLEDFLTWGVEKYPAEHYMVVLWNHGNGWNDENVYRMAADMNVRVQRRGVEVASGGTRSVSLRRLRVVGGKRFRRSLFSRAIQEAIRVRGIAYDDNAKDFLDNIELKKALTTMSRKLNRKIDILGMDACLMSMAEVIYQVRDHVGITVASEQTEPGDGWPYNTLLGLLKAKPAVEAKELAVAVVDKYLASYKAVDEVTQSACDTSVLPDLTPAIDELAKTMADRIQDPATYGAITQARIHAQSYEVEDYVDLYSFAELLQNATTDSALQAACQSARNAVQNSGFVLRSGYKGTEVEDSHGVSIYFPLKKISSLYATLDFAKDTEWANFLKSFVAGTRKPMRLAATA